MHKARAFFFVCAGLLCLALAYHLGARSAGAQVGTRMVGIDIMGSWPGRIAIDESGQLYEEHNIDSGNWTATSRLPGRPVALTTRNDDSNRVWVLMENGDLYEANGSVTGGWPPRFVYNIYNISGGTPAQPVSIGQLKAKYAAPAGK